MPRNVDELLEQAEALHRARRHTSAIGLYQQVLAIDPHDALCRYLLGLAYFETNNLAAAAQEMHRAIALEADVAEYHCDLGRVLFALGDFGAAIAAERRALALNPNYLQALYVLGNACSICQQFDAAIEAYRNLLAHQPDVPNVINNLGMSLLALGRVGEAVGCFDQLLSISSADAAAHSNRVYAMYFSPAYSAGDIRKELEHWNARHAGPPSGAPVSGASKGSFDRPLRIGYVSPDFREHVVGWNLMSWIAKHDRTRFHITAYSSTGNPDGITQRLQAAVQVWRDISRMNDSEVVQRIREDRIDILVDLAQHTSGNRLQVFARKPAPIQMTYLGYPGSSGLEAMDYRLSDPYLDTAESLGDYCEQTIRLPRTYWCYQPGGATPDEGKPPVEARGFITFGSLNQFQKMSEPTLDLWREILRAVANSRLILNAPPGSARAGVIAYFGAAGIGTERLEFVGRSSWPDYIQLYQRIDIALDPFPYCGGITTCDALWMGVPVVTLSGRGGVSRSGLSILSTAGLPELIAQTPAQYRAIAQSLAADAGRLARLRAELRQRLSNSALMDAAHFVLDIEGAYEAMWRTGGVHPHPLHSDSQSSCLP